MRAVIYFWTCLLFFGCTKELQYEGELEDPVLVVESFVHAENHQLPGFNFTEIRGSITVSNFFLNDAFAEYPELINDLQLNFCDLNDQSCEPISEVTLNGEEFIEFRHFHKINPEHEYSIQAIHPNYDTVSVSCKMVAPPKVKLLDYSIGKVIERDFGWQKITDTLVTFRFEVDDVKGFNGVAARVYRKLRTTVFEDGQLTEFDNNQQGNLIIDGIGIEFEYYPTNYGYSTSQQFFESAVIYDQNFDGAKAEFLIHVPYRNFLAYDNGNWRREEGSEYKFVFGSADQRALFYLSSLKKAFENQDVDLFSEPVAIINGAEGGIGAFGIFSVDTLFTPL